MEPPREEFSQISPELLAALRDIARKEGRQFHAVLEDALKEYLEGKPRASVMAHFQASVERNRRLGELLAE